MNDLAKINSLVDQLIDALLDTGTCLTERDVVKTLGFRSEVELFAFQSLVKAGYAEEFILELDTACAIDQYVLQNHGGSLTSLAHFASNGGRATGWTTACHPAMAG